MRRIPAWPRHTETSGIPRLNAKAMTQAFIGSWVLVAFIAWWSFTPAPDFLLLTAILAAGWVIAWMTYAVLIGDSRHNWRVYAGRVDKHRGRDSRVATLRGLIEDGDQPERVEQLRVLLDQIVTDRLRARGWDRHTHPEDARAILGADLAAFLTDSTRRMTPRDLDVYLQRIERI